MVYLLSYRDNNFKTDRGTLQMTVSQSSIRSNSLELLVAYRQDPSVSLRNKIVRLNTGLVRKIAYQVSHQCSEPYEDLEQIGYLGLIRAIERFNPSQGYAFSSFAVPYIRGEMSHFLRDRSSTIKVPRRWQDLQREGRRTRIELTKALGRQPSDREIAEELGVSLDDWREAKMATLNRLPLSLDATINNQSDSPLTLSDVLPDTRYQTLQRFEEDRQQIQRALNQLEDKTRTAIEFVFLKDLSRKEVAAQIGVSPMTVTRRIQRGLEQMVAILQPQTISTDP
jgi:RNA polymerase sigma-B factor